MGFKALPLVAALLLPGCALVQTADPCREKPSSGRGDEAIPRFWHDPEWGECRAFIWGGRGGNAPFETMEACIRRCDAPAGDLWQQHQKDGNGGKAVP